MRYTWGVVVTINEIDDENNTESVIGTMEGWQLFDTTTDAIQVDFESFIDEYTGGSKC